MHTTLASTPIDEICVRPEGGRNKLLMDTERVDGYQAHVILVIGAERHDRQDASKG